MTTKPTRAQAASRSSGFGLALFAVLALALLAPTQAFADNNHATTQAPMPSQVKAEVQFEKVIHNAGQTIPQTAIKATCVPGACTPCHAAVAPVALLRDQLEPAANNFVRVATIFKDESSQVTRAVHYAVLNVDAAEVTHPLLVRLQAVQNGEHAANFKGEQGSAAIKGEGFQFDYDSGGFQVLKTVRTGAFQHYTRTVARANTIGLHVLQA